MLKIIIQLLFISLLFLNVVCVFTIKSSMQHGNSSRTNQSVVEVTEDFSNVSEFYDYLPIVVNTWHFTEAGTKAWDILSQGGSALDAVEAGCSTCEELQCDGTVGYGGSPDENGETTLDALIMDGEYHRVGAVGALRRVKDAISVARRVMEHTEHTLLVGSQATEFAIMMGFAEQNLTTAKSEGIYKLWKKRNCQPNFWKNVQPDPKQSCGPFQPLPNNETVNEQNFIKRESVFNSHNHDTIGMVAIDSLGRIAAGTSTNGASHKIPGRVGDSPIPGSGAYVDIEVGGAAATGDGDVMMRFMPSLIAVEGMRRGLSPSESAIDALQRITKYESRFSGAIVVLSIGGEIGAACNNLPTGVFNFTVGNSVAGVYSDFTTCLDSVTFNNELSLLE